MQTIETETTGTIFRDIFQKNAMTKSQWQVFDPTQCIFDNNKTY